MKFDVNVLQYLSKDDFRVLTAVELGMKTHEIVPADRVDQLARLKRGGCYKVLKNLLRHKLVHHDSTKYDGFRLTNLGYDFLAIKALVNRGVFVSVGRQLGVGKESVIFEVGTEDGTILAIKLHRLGKTSFRAVKSKRDYVENRTHFNWLYLSRLAAKKEYAFMKKLGEEGFPVPNAVDWNRHCVVMSLVPGYPLVQVKEIQNHDVVFETIISQIIHMAEVGLIHCDFNEFNIMIDDNEKVTMIDFPQIVSTSHRNAEMYFDRDVECIIKFFRKRPSFSSIEKSSDYDKVLAASGFTRKDQEEIEKITQTNELNSESGNDSEATDESESSDDESEATGEALNERSLPDAYIEASINEMELLHVVDQHESTVGCNANGGLGDNPSCNEFESNGPETQASEEHILTASCDEIAEVGETSQANEEEDDHAPSETLEKSLNKHRRDAIKRTRGKRRSLSSRNTYKDKGGKSSNNSKVQKQFI
ncbi:hypothetical protein AQUCO_01400824v1 [Aquilegia coerulea]|uniref:Serine/threonine-protein kinase RIO2 n=1 Tax=Aquilegia coerulea TaxID=218851 RepID=A0A2G5DYB5_AQUCA|nr:hypothetical protein AQUCO_01400824v1 [Aquilegia coerulea]